MPGLDEYGRYMGPLPSSAISAQAFGPAERDLSLKGRAAAMADEIADELKIPAWVVHRYLKRAREEWAARPAPPA
ncbi:hypothetical protein [Microtetraspora sp. NBRC 13810]|uniref:hypothetical protein n=1 Tax=Microtetraspora sp. NBRC 13810 TaxID=3030990 RepID=UPI00255688D8|nr:hypothetical protein [Microtetraspora sp. NBRC 13810]